LTWARTNPLGAFLNVALNPRLRNLLILFFAYQVAFMVYPAVWAYFTEARFGWSPGMIGLSLGAFGMAMAIVQGGLIRFILNWLGDRGTVIYGIVFNFFAFLVLGFVESGPVAMLFIPLTALGAVVTPAVQGMMSRATPDDSQGELQGVLSSSAALATIFSPLAMTYAFAVFAAEDADPYMPGAPFLLSAILMFVCLFAILSTRRTVQS
jgi:DHA1 family tetracycline resistance protein-like MFS transporter